MHDPAQTMRYYELATVFVAGFWIGGTIGVLIMGFFCGYRDDKEKAELREALREARCVPKF